MVPITLILLIVMCVTFVIVFGSIYFIRKSKESQSQRNTSTHEDITLSDQICQKPLPGNFIISIYKINVRKYFNRLGIKLCNKLIQDEFILLQKYHHLHNRLLDVLCNKVCTCYIAL